MLMFVFVVGVGLGLAIAAAIGVSGSVRDALADSVPDAGPVDRFGLPISNARLADIDWESKVRQRAAVEEAFLAAEREIVDNSGDEE